MEGLFSLLFFAVVFYLMMRFGCGAHMIHGGHGQHDHANKAPDNQIDPVCGMKLEDEHGYGIMRDGQLYRFCSRDCLDKFESDPDKYAKGVAS